MIISIRKHLIKCISKLTILIVLFNLLSHEVKATSADLSKIKLKGKWFVDESDRIILLHGINAVKKEFPWVPNVPHTDMTDNEQISNLKKWGFNVVRLGVMWSGLMPEKNKINETYLNEMIQIVDNLASHGIYSLIDLHQDMMSSNFASYDGVPKWVLDEMPNSWFPFPWPLPNGALNTSLFTAYLSESCGFAFQCLYDNRNHFGDYFLQYWSTIAQTFANNTAVLGYDIINEPWAGDVFANPRLFDSSLAGSKNLLPLYDKAYETIRKYDSKTLIFYEPVIWGILFDTKNFGAGFDRAPGNDIRSTVLSWHHYCWILGTAGNPIKNGTYPEFYRVLCDVFQLTESFEAIRNDMLDIGGGASFLSEFGECSFKDPEGIDPNYLDTTECKNVMDMSDRYFTSWTYWDSDFYNDVGSVKVINDKLVNAFSRVYPKVTNGIPDNFNFNITTKEFLYKFNLNSNVDLATEIFIPSHVYPSGFEVLLSPHLKWSYDRTTNLLIIQLNDEIKQEFYDKKRKILNTESIVHVIARTNYN